MAFKAKIKNTVYDLKDGFIIKEEFNETLDSGTIQFATYKEELNKEPFDDVTIYDTNGSIAEKHIEVDSISDDIYSFPDSQDLSKCDHFYTMSLFSATKELERITMPSCSVTQPLSGTKTSVWTMISRYCGHFLPKIRIYDSSNNGWKWSPIFTIDNAVKTKFENVDCPEFQWDNPTLREVLNDLMSTKDCIVIVRDHVITYYDLTAKGNAIDLTKLSRMTSSFSSSDYTSELTMFMKNGVGKNVTKSYRYQTPRTADESGEITTTNMAITTQKPIYAVKSLKIYYIAADTTSSDTTGDKLRLHCADVADRVLEYDEWRLKSRISLIGYWSALPHWTDSHGYEAPEHRISYLYYKRGGKSIENLGTIYKGGVILSETFLSETYVGICNTIRTLNASQKVDFQDNIKHEPRRMFYEIEYETLYEQAMHFGKSLPNGHPEIRTFDNQSNAYVDIQHLSIFEYAKVNRLSNQIKEIYGEYVSESEVPLLGDYIGDYILFSKETTYYDGKILFKGYLTKNYILKDYYTGVMAKKRSWQIASQSEALTRHEITKFYIEASFSKKNDNISFLDSINYTGHGRGLIYDLTYVKKFDNDVAGSNILSQIRLYTYSSVGRQYHPALQKAFALDSDVEILGNSICWTFGFEDNYKASDYAVKDDDLWTQNFYAYANDDGTFTQITMDVVYNIPDYLSPYSLPIPYEEGESGVVENATRVALEDMFRSKPLIERHVISSQSNDEVYGFTIRKSLHKDSREIIKSTIQVEYCSDTQDIIVKPEFLEYVRAVNTGDNNSSALKVYVSFDETYSIQDTQAKGSGYNLSNLGYFGFQGNSSSIKIFQNVTALQGIKSWCLATSSGRILIAVNGENREIYFNLLQSRDTNIYYSALDRTVIGNIEEGGTTNLQENYNAHTDEINDTQNTIVINAGVRRLINMSNTIESDD